MLIASCHDASRATMSSEPRFNTGSQRPAANSKRCAGGIATMINSLDGTPASPEGRKVQPHSVCFQTLVGIGQLVRPQTTGFVLHGQALGHIGRGGMTGRLCPGLGLAFDQSHFKDAFCYYSSSSGCGGWRYSKLFSEVGTRIRLWLK